MKENQHNDNLERFFKANLENYSPEPSADFWERMGPVIPAKPSFWSRWKSPVRKWSGMGLVALIVGAILWFWQHDRAQLARLSKTVEVQQQQIDKLGKPALEQTPGEAAQHKIEPATDSGTTKSPVATQPQASVEKPDFIGEEKISKPSNKANISGVEAQGKVGSEQIVANQPVAKNQVQNGERESAVNEPAAMAEPTVNNELMFDLNLTTPDFLAIRNTTFKQNNKNKLTVNAIGLRAQKNPYPRFSAEAGASVFRLPLGRLFQQDTFLTGSTKASYAIGGRINYEINSSFALQGGYEFTNLRARRLALRYNSFPVAVVKRWNWSRRSHLEGKFGASLNSLVSARTDSDGQSVKGLKTTWVGLHTGLSATWDITDNLTFLVGPRAGVSLTPMTTGRRSWDVGVGASIRYHL